MTTNYSDTKHELDETGFKKSTIYKQKYGSDSDTLAML